jgi:hypothetical protein
MCLTDKHLEECIRIATEIKPDTETLVKQKQHQLDQCGPTSGPWAYLSWPANHNPILVLSNFFN